MNSSLHRFVLAFDRIAGLITCPQCLRLNRSGYQLRRSCSLPAFLDAGDPVDTTDLALAIGRNKILLPIRPGARPDEFEPAFDHICPLSKKARMFPAKQRQRFDVTNRNPMKQANPFTAKDRHAGR